MKYLLKCRLRALALLAILAVLYLVFNWTALSLTHKLSFAVTIAIVLHILEEERFPGGFGYMFSVVRAKSAGIDWAEALADLFLHGVLRPPARDVEGATGT